MSTGNGEDIARSAGRLLLGTLALAAAVSFIAVTVFKVWVG